MSTPFRAASSSSSRSRRLRSMVPPRFLVRVVILVVWPVSNPETEMDFWNSTHVSCWAEPAGLAGASSSDAVSVVSFDLDAKYLVFSVLLTRLALELS